ncbi:MAG: hypothetical protein N3A57_06980, partial [Negativicutes bacterium]|nr:hypothetical protein [Negativicutes bacterium]
VVCLVVSWLIEQPAGKNLTDQRPFAEDAANKGEAAVFVEIAGLENAKIRVVRDVFNVPSEYRSGQPGTDDARTGQPAILPAAAADAGRETARPQLNGVAISNGKQAAMLSVAGQTEICYVGDRIGGYRVVEIDADHAVLQGDAGGRIRVEIADRTGADGKNGGSRRNRSESGTEKAGGKTTATVATGVGDIKPAGNQAPQPGKAGN